MPQPIDGPATVALTKAQLSMTDSTDDTYIGTVIAAVNVVVRRLPCADIDAAEWPKDVELGSNMLGARLVRRRNSPSGVEALTEQGAVYVSRSDPDVAMMLALGSYAPPMVG
jgi:hypothetical protein